MRVIRHLWTFVKTFKRNYARVKEVMMDVDVFPPLNGT
jgi:hypothetical protein